MKKTLSIVLFVLLVFLAVACNPESTTHVHEWELTSEVPATCQETGLKTYTCKVCKDEKTEVIAKTNHTHSKNASGDVVQALTCSQEGITTYRCNVCGTSYEEVVKPEDAEELGLEVTHVSQLKATSSRVATYKLYGGYVTYLTTDGDFNMTDLGEEAAVAEKGEYEIANYDSSITVAKTQFTPVCQKALCATCGAELSDDVQNYLKKPVVSTTTPTADDYESILGDWTYSVTAEEASLKTALGTLANKGDQYMLNFLVSADSTDAKKVKVTTYEASVVEGVRTTATSATVEGTFSYDETTKVRTLTFTPTGGSVFNKAIKLSEEDGKYTLTVNSKTVYSSLADDSSGTVSTGEFTSELSYNPKHTEHKLGVMTHYGVNYITSTSNLGVNHTHYLACEGCDVAYIPETVTVASDTDKFDSNNYCKTCGAPNSNHNDWYDISISSATLTSADKFWVVKDTVLKIGYSEYRAFNGETYAMTGYTTLTYAESTAEGIKPTAKGAKLVFADKSST